MRFLQGFALAAISGLLTWSSISFADRPQWNYKQFPFNQSLDMDLIYKVTTASPKELIKIIESHGIKIYRVHSKTPELSNPVYANLEWAPEKLINDAEFTEEDYNGATINVKETCCEVSQTTILLGETAPTDTLIHEFLHTQFRYDQFQPDYKMTERYRMNSHKLNFYQRQLFSSPAYLLNPLWRRDILSAMKEQAQVLYNQIRLARSQEVIIGKVLLSYLDAKNPYSTPERRKHWQEYGAVSLANAMTMYNNLESMLEWNRNTVRNLRQALIEKDIDPNSLVKKEKLEQLDADQFERDAVKILDSLKPVVRDIIDLHGFFNKK
jgi:hypothetical protein